MLCFCIAGELLLLSVDLILVDDNYKLADNVQFLNNIETYSSTLSMKDDEHDLKHYNN